MSSFTSLGLSSWLNDALAQLSVRKPTPIQAACIPPILEGKDVIGSAKTGSGKTAAFALPILQSLSKDPYGVFALVLTPTRELAFQIAEQFEVLGTGINLKLNVVVGGLDMMTQALALQKRPHVIVATPGRLADHINSSSGAVYLDRLKFLVLDEADRLLEPTFFPDLQVILEKIPKKRQTLLFSATMTRNMEKVAQFSMTDPFVFHASEKYDTIEKLDQRYVFMPKRVRDVYLSFLLRSCFSGSSTIIFAGRCRTCELLRVMLRELGLKVTALHSRMSQTERLASLAKFKSAVVPILIATDVGSRGLDIPAVKLVINYDVPSSAKDYIHRVGRTARAGRGGVAVTMVTEHDIELVHNIESKTGKKLVEYDVAEKDVLENMNEVFEAKRVATMHLEETNATESSKKS